MVFRRVASGKDRPWHTLLAGGIGGYLVFSSDNPVNNQVRPDPWQWFSFDMRPA